MPSSDDASSGLRMNQLTPQPTASKRARFHHYPFWSPRFWHGMRWQDWLRLAAKNRFRIHPLRIPMAALLTMITPINNALALLQRLRFGRAIADAPTPQAPVFIIGHWRSGTTYLHELMVLDDRFAFPTTFECFAPHHFLVSEWFFTSFGNFLMPSRRPMDNVEVGWSRPQEDEFALLAMGAPSPYERMAFPNHPPTANEFLDMENVPPGDLERWKLALQRFLRLLAVKNHDKRVILKSPTHTGRIRVLAELFPEARFIHLVRDPYEVFPSTRRLWEALDRVQAFQLPRHAELDEYVFSSFERMYRGFERQRPHVDPARLYDLRYEDLVADPIGRLRDIYRSLGLGDFEPARGAVEKFLADKKDYRRNKHALDMTTKAAIDRRWGPLMHKYGYCP